MNILGVILARKGSKGIPRKNYLKLNNQFYFCYLASSSDFYQKLKNHK